MSTNESHSVRQPVDGDPELTELVHAGDYIRSSNGTEGLVVELHRYQYNVDNQIVAAYAIHYWNRLKLEHLAISDAISLHDYSTWYEVVVHQGKLCKLFATSEQTFEVVPVPDDVTISPRAQAFVLKTLESGQLTLL